MPKVRRSKKPPPDGWELIEPTLEELEQKMREGKKKKKYRLWLEGYVDNEMFLFSIRNIMSRIIINSTLFLDFS